MRLPQRPEIPLLGGAACCASAAALLLRQLSAERLPSADSSSLNMSWELGRNKNLTEIIHDLMFDMF